MSAFTRAARGTLVRYSVKVPDPDKDYQDSVVQYYGQVLHLRSDYAVVGGMYTPRRLAYLMKIGAKIRYDYLDVVPYQSISESLTHDQFMKVS